MRPVAPADLEGLVELCLTARAESTVGAQLCSADGDRLRVQLGTLLAVQGGQALVGLLDGELAGLLLGRVVGPGPFTDDVSLHVEALYVRPSTRRRGLGHALLGGALTLAEEAGASELYAVHLPGARGVQRFFARLGFAPAAAHRVVATSTLQRRLAGEHVRPGGGRRGAHGLEDLIARRRQVRSETQSGPVDLRELHGTDVPAAGRGQGTGRSSISRQVSRAVASRRDAESSSTIS
ncbi:GNAT family N-acetyltransferase [Pengzhenrongella sicca]|uniref:GNAT family N-acetyltransferase n=1 Tax=Pengzhenrongella sicca TaxID=2819238 RepID=UPI001D0CB4E7|nr:GNAT family N-acetyltransferase [Pengzhenrongella sicca]